MALSDANVVLVFELFGIPQGGAAYESLSTSTLFGPFSEPYDYAAIVTALETKLGEGGIAPEDVAQTIAKALTSERAKQTYYVGRDARLFRLYQKFVGERRRDRQLMRLIGLPY